MLIWCSLGFFIASLICGIMAYGKVIDGAALGFCILGFYVCLVFFILTLAVGLIDPRGGE